MAVVIPIKLSSTNNLEEISAAESIQMLRRVAYCYNASGKRRDLTRVSSGWNMSGMTDTRKAAGAATDQTAAQGEYASAANTPNITNVSNTSNLINQGALSTASTAIPADTDNLRFPLYVTDTNMLMAMTATDFYDSIIDPALTLMTSGDTSSTAAGMYHIATSTSVSGSTLISASPVFTDTRANAGAFTAAGIPETLDQPTTVSNYYLHRVTPSSSANPLPMYIKESDGQMYEYTQSAWDALLTAFVEHYANKVAGSRIQYSINGTGSQMGSAMADTYLSGSSTAGYATRFVSPDSYRTQEFPNGTPATQNTYRLRVERV
jgi:hypothetical protein